jgi:hypothetical protein
MKRYFIDPYVTYCYPFDVNRHICKSSEFGVLEKYMYKTYTRNKIDKIICELITRHPYINNSMHIDIRIMWYNNHNTQGYYHILNLKNDKYDKQKRTTKPIIKYEK